VSPRRRITADEHRDVLDLSHARPRPRWRWGPAVLSALAGLLVVAAIAASTYMVVQYESDRRAALRDASALGYVRGFMTAYTSLDPFNANDYADRILEHGTGEFAAMYREKMNQIVIRVAQSEPTTGEVLEAGVQRWYEDGSADVLVATKISSTMPDGETTVESGSRWVVTVIEEGQQWKISKLIQVY
jgi:Mce-associated membrane protein